MTEPTWTLPSDDAVKTILAERIDKQRDGVGIVVGVIDPDGQRVVAHGRYKRGGRREVDGRTLFEIGSITKVFTSLLLGDMALQGEVALDDPVAKHLPDGVATPQRNGRKITLADLATHRSGLPRMPTNFASSNPSNPYTFERLYAFLGSYVLTRDIGAQYEYSNIGLGLLGHALARRLSTDYESLVKERVTGPLGLNDTAIHLSRDQLRRLAHGHDVGKFLAPSWNRPEPLFGGGMLRSTTQDLLSFLAVVLGYQGGPLKPAMDAQLAYPFQATGQPGVSQGLGWHATETESGRVVHHGGGTAGYRAFMGLNPARGWGAVVLTNTYDMRGPADIAMHLLTGAPLRPALKRRRKPSPGTEDVLRRYVVSRAEGQPSYDDMAPALAEGSRARWPSMEARIKARGALKSITFLRVDREGRDVYDAAYENGRVEWSITPLGSDGKVAGIRGRTIA